MFNFTTLSVYNKISTSGPDKNLWINNGKKPYVRIGNTRFDAANVESIQKKLPTKESLASVTFDLSDIGNTTMGRIVLYIGLSMNSQDSFYANDYVYKGKPLFIEFPVTGTAADDAAKLKKIADKYLLFTVGPEKILSVTVNDSTVTFEGVNGYLIIKKAVMQKWDPEATTVDCCTTNGDYIDVVTGVPVIYTTSSDGTVTTSEKVYDGVTEGGRNMESNEVAISPGLEAFGDYNWIIHNLRLPTAANYYPWSPANRMGEMPIPGQNYVLFIIRLKTERDGIAGGAVGMRVTSVTTHVLYVAEAYASTVATALANLGSIDTDADTKLLAPFV